MATAAEGFQCPRPRQTQSPGILDIQFLFARWSLESGFSRFKDCQAPLVLSDLEYFVLNYPWYQGILFPCYFWRNFFRFVRLFSVHNETLYPFEKLWVAVFSLPIFMVFMPVIFVFVTMHLITKHIDAPILFFIVPPRSWERLREYTLETHPNHGYILYWLVVFGYFCVIGPPWLLQLLFTCLFSLIFLPGSLLGNMGGVLPILFLVWFTLIMFKLAYMFVIVDDEVPDPPRLAEYIEGEEPDTWVNQLLMMNVSPEPFDLRHRFH